MGYTPHLSHRLAAFSACMMDFKHNHTRISADHPGEEMHIHDHFEIYVNVSGEGTFMVENSVYPLTRGDVILTAPNEMHHGVWVDGTMHEHYCIWLPAGENAPWLTRFRERPRGRRNLLSLSLADKEHLLRALERLERELLPEGDARRATAALLQVLLLIDSADVGREGEKTELPHPLPDILAEIGHRLGESIRMADVAERYFISQSTLNRLFRLYLRVSPHTYLENLRLARAKQMLAAGRDVTETALECGFSDSSYFILLFRRRFGVTPGRYRKQNYQLATKGDTV